MNEMTTLDTLESRVNRIQSSVWLWRITTLGGFTLAFILGNAWHDSMPDSLRVSDLVIVDDAGEPAVKIGTVDGASMFTMSNDDGEVIVAMGATANGAGMITTSSGTGHMTIALMHRENGDGMIRTYKPDGSPLVAVGAIDGKGSLVTFGALGEVIGSVPSR